MSQSRAWVCMWKSKITTFIILAHFKRKLLGCCCCYVSPPKNLHNLIANSHLLYEILWLYWMLLRPRTSPRVDYQFEKENKVDTQNLDSLHAEEEWLFVSHCFFLSHLVVYLIYKEYKLKKELPRYCYCFSPEFLSRSLSLSHPNSSLSQASELLPRSQIFHSLIRSIVWSGKACVYIHI